MKQKKEIPQKFIKLAEHLIELMVNSTENLPDNFTYSDIGEVVKLKTAKALQKGFEEAYYSRNENGGLYYSGMIEDYGGFIDKEIGKNLPKEKGLIYTPDPVTIENRKLKSKLNKAKKALQTIADAGYQPAVKINTSDARGFIIIAKKALDEINKK